MGYGYPDGGSWGVDGDWYNAAHAPLYTTPEFNLTVTALLMISPKNPLGSFPSPCCGAPPFSIAAAWW